MEQYIVFMNDSSVITIEAEGWEYVPSYHRVKFVIGDRTVALFNFNNINCIVDKDRVQQVKGRTADGKEVKK